MCPAAERARRENLHDIQIFERADINDSGRTSADLAVRRFARTVRVTGDWVLGVVTMTPKYSTIASKSHCIRIGYFYNSAANIPFPIRLMTRNHLISAPGGPSCAQCCTFEVSWTARMQGEGECKSVVDFKWDCPFGDCILDGHGTKRMKRHMNALRGRPLPLPGLD